MPTITIEVDVPQSVVKRNKKIKIGSLEDKDALLLLSLVLEKVLSPTEEEIAKIAERLEENAWKKIEKQLQQ